MNNNNNAINNNDNNNKNNEIMKKMMVMPIVLQRCLETVLSKMERCASVVAKEDGKINQSSEIQIPYNWGYTPQTSGIMCGKFPPSEYECSPGLTQLCQTPQSAARR